MQKHTDPAQSDQASCVSTGTVDVNPPRISRALAPPSPRSATEEGFGARSPVEPCSHVVDGLAAGDKEVTCRDGTLPGFGVRVHPSGVGVYLVQGRGPDGSKRVTVGRHGVLSAEEARQRGAGIHGFDRIMHAGPCHSATHDMDRHFMPCGAGSGLAGTIAKG